MEIKNLFSTVVGGLVSGATLALIFQYRDETVNEPSALDKVKAWENKVEQDGEKQALKLAQVKQDAKLKAQINAHD